jgi:hypothetical protein
MALRLKTNKTNKEKTTMEQEISLKQLRQKAIIEEIKLNDALIWTAARTTRACNHTIATLRKEFLTLEKDLFLLNKRIVAVLPDFPPANPVKAQTKPTPLTADKLMDQALACFENIPASEQNEVINLLIDQLNERDEEEYGSGN